MNCDQARERLVDRWISGVDEADRIGLDRHLSQCAACREESEALSTLWNALGDLPIEEADRGYRASFHHMLEAYRLGAAEARPARRTFSLHDWLRSALPEKPLLQLATAAMALVFGIMAGHFYTARSHDEERIAQLNSEMHNMRQLVALSLMQQQSASERLRGVSWSVQLEPAGKEVIGALLHTLNTDSNVNVRLAAVDALKDYSSNLAVQRGLRDALLRQTSPLVQISLLELASKTKDRSWVETIERLRTEPELHPAVKERIAQTLARIE